MLPSIKVIIYKYRSSINNEYPLMLRITHNRKSKYLSIGISSKLELWNEKEGLPKKKHPLFTEITTTINSLKAKINKESMNLLNQEKEVNLDALLAVIQPKKEESIPIKKEDTKLLFEYLEEIQNRLTIANRVSYANSFRDLKSSLKKVTDDMPIIKIDVNFLNSYETNMLSRGVKLNAVASYMRVFRVVLNNARKEKIVPKSFYPFEDFSFKRYNNIKTTKRAISKEDMQKIVNFKSAPTDSRLYLAQQIFLFSFYCRGINFTDIAFLTWENIQNNRLIYRRSKTKELFNIELLEPAKDIINYYKTNHFQGEKKYIFPLLNSTHITPIQIDYRLERMMRIVNKSLKELAVLTGIEQHLTTYVARHSFATILKKSGTPIAVISELMGHDSEHTTKIYLQDFENSLLDDACKGIL